jgi:hypothetical protein
MPDVIAHAGSEIAAASSIADPEQGVAASIATAAEVESSAGAFAAASTVDVADEPPHVSHAPTPPSPSPSPIVRASTRAFEITPAS